MILLAHMFGVPVEETLVPLASGAGAAAAVWLVAFVRSMGRARV